jgi:tetratricopeptide (TPR) repeat protein
VKLWTSKRRAGRWRARIAVAKASVILVALIVAIEVRGTEPIIVEYSGGRNRVAVKFWTDAESQLKKGDVENARRSVDAAIRSDPTLWPALYTRAKIFIRQHQYELALRDCGEALRQDRTFIDAALLRAQINERLGRHADTIKEIDHVVSIRPRPDAFADALSQRAWFRLTCPDPSFRDEKQALKDAMTACKLMHWEDENMIDTLACAYAAAGDFDSALRYEGQALAMKGISPDDSKALQQHLALFKQHRAL